MDALIACRLKRMRRLCRSGDSLKRRKTSLNEWRKEKRQKILNQLRGIDLEWFQMEAKDDPEYDICISDDFKSVQMLIDFFDGNNAMSDQFVKRCIEETLKFLSEEHQYSQDLVSKTDICYKLSAFLAKPLTSDLRVGALALIEGIVSHIDVDANKEVLIKSELILSIMIGFDTFDVQVLTKTVVVMQTITDMSSDLLIIALNNGYLVFLTNIIKTSQVFRQRKSTQTNRFNRMSELKLNLIREISKTLQTMAANMSGSEIISNLMPAFDKLLTFRDTKIVVNVLSSLMSIVERNGESIVMFSKQLMVSITELMSKNDSDITIAVIQLWKLIVGAIDTKFDNYYSNLIIESNLLKNLHSILANGQNNRLVTEVAILLTQFVDKFSIAMKLLFETDLIPVIIKAMISGHNCSQRQLMTTLTALVLKTKSMEEFNYLVNNRIVEAMAYMLSSNDPKLIQISRDNYNCILMIAEKLGRKECVLNRALNYNFDLIIDWTPKANNPFQLISVSNM